MKNWVAKGMASNVNDFNLTRGMNFYLPKSILGRCVTQKIKMNSKYLLVSGLPLSFGFAVQFYNPISSIKYTVPYHTDSTLEYERIPFLDTIQVLDPAPAGTGEWVKIQAPKWDYNWVEFYLPFAEPFQFEFGYTLPLEFGSDIFNMDFSLATKKWYIPASGQPYFNLSLEGTPRRVQFTFNNTGLVFVF